MNSDDNNNPLLELTPAGEQHTARINEDDSGIPKIPTVPQFSRQMVKANKRGLERYLTMNPSQRDAQYTKFLMQSVIDSLPVFEDKKIIRQGLNVEELARIIENGARVSDGANSNNSGRRLLQVEWILQDIDAWIDRDYSATTRQRIMPPTAGYTLLKKNEESGDGSESDERVAFLAPDGIDSSSSDYPLIHTSPRTRDRSDGGEDGQLDDSLSPEPSETYNESNNENSRISSEDKPLIEPVPSTSNNNPHSVAEKSTEDGAPNINNDPASVELLGVPDITDPEPNRLALQKDLKLIREYIESPSKRKKLFVEMMTIVASVQRYQSQNVVVRRSFNTERLELMLRNAEDKEQSTGTSTSNDPVVDQQMLELLQLLEKDINIWLKQNVDPKSRSDPTYSTSDRLRDCEEGHPNRQCTSSECQRINRPDNSYSVMPVFLAHEYRNDRPLFGLVDDYERELRKRTRDRVMEIRGYLTELFNVPENARGLQWSTNTMNLLVEYVPTLQMFQVEGISLRDIPLYVMRRILDDGADDMIHGNNAIFPLPDIVDFIIENINLWLAANPIIENRVNHQQLQNAEGGEDGERIPEIPDDEHDEAVIALPMNRPLNIMAVDMTGIADDSSNEAVNARCTNSEKIVYFGIFVVVAFWVGYQIF
ncbi:hypothetical protein WR25_10618 [Diploscapter pachys]|uniref:Uncharacterized protein n=1 Tax=Diploscapter pachys TaxID=2018661 RepID=A0A2A2JFI7_9BILA|nr:hypothetical protein WR25_10618 [Diploscapter pachys]